jgi:hypothetical protein
MSLNLIYHNENSAGWRPLDGWRSSETTWWEKKIMTKYTVKSLIDYVGLTFDQPDTIYVAGGFGGSLDISKAIAIGLLPDIDAQKIQFIGNSSIMGERMALLSAPRR